VGHLCRRGGRGRGNISGAGARRMLQDDGSDGWGSGGDHAAVSTVRAREGRRSTGGARATRAGAPSHARARGEGAEGRSQGRELCRSNGRGWSSDEPGLLRRAALATSSCNGRQEDIPCDEEGTSKRGCLDRRRASRDGLEPSGGARRAGAARPNPRPGRSQAETCRSARAAGPARGVAGSKPHRRERAPRWGRRRGRWEGPWSSGVWTVQNP
jgi:hypothetical protein